MCEGINSGSVFRFHIWNFVMPIHLLILFLYLEFCYAHTSINFILLSNSTNSPEFTVLVTCSFTFCWIRIRNYNSGSRQKFRVHADPDPQHPWIRIRIRNPDRNGLQKCPLIEVAVYVGCLQDSDGPPEDVPGLLII